MDIKKVFVLATRVGLYALLVLLLGSPVALPFEPAEHGVADLRLKFPFEPGIPWELTNGWEGHSRYADLNADGSGGDWNRYALDFAPAQGVSCEGLAVLAVAPGRIHAHDQDIYGAERLVIEHADELYSLYVHLQQGSVRLAVGTAVSYGTVIGACGNTGRSTGAHLHFQLYRGPTWDRDDGILPLPIDGLRNPEQLKGRLSGLYSSNTAPCPPPAETTEPTIECGSMADADSH